jgi:hypothetical protein
VVDVSVPGMQGLPNQQGFSGPMNPPHMMGGPHGMQRPPNMHMNMQPPISTAAHSRPHIPPAAPLTSTPAPAPTPAPAAIPDVNDLLKKLLAAGIIGSKPSVEEAPGSGPQSPAAHVAAESSSSAESLPEIKVKPGPAPAPTKTVKVSGWRCWS